MEQAELTKGLGRPSYRRVAAVGALMGANEGSSTVIRSWRVGPAS